MDWEALIDRHGDALLLFARRWSCSEAEAEDFVQEGFVRFWRAYERCPVPDQAVPGHLFINVKRAALDRLRSERRRRDREIRAQACEEAAAAMFEPACGHDDDRLRAEKALKGLPGAQCEVVVMKIWGGLTFRQIGLSLGIPANTAASRYRLALGSLRKTFSEDTDHAD